jgi:hypothetical protein
MSGFANATGFAPPTSLSGFMGLLQTASFRGVPFKVLAARVKKGRRWAVHEYPYVDGGWPEDMGRMLRSYWRHHTICPKSYGKPKNEQRQRVLKAAGRTSGQLRLANHGNFPLKVRLDRAGVPNKPNKLCHRTILDKSCGDAFMARSS